MPVRFESGDLFATDELKAFAHGCNCAGAMGKGIAVAFRERWPEMYEEYRRLCRGGEFQLGDVFVWEEGENVVFNLGTQKTWRTRAELWAVEKSLLSMLKEAERRKLTEIGLPRIGAGLGGLEWADVRSLLERLADSSSVTLRVCETFVPGEVMGG